MISLTFCFMCFILLLIIFPLPHAIAYPEQNNVTGTGKVFHPAIVADRENIYVVWTNDPSGSGDIFFRRSTDFGNSYGSTINISNNEGSSDTPKIAVSDNNVYIVWSDDSSEESKILFKRSSDGGYSFGDVKILSNDTVHSDTPQIALSGNDIIVIWRGCIEGSYPSCENLFYQKSTDGGNSFSDIVMLSNGTLGGVLNTQLLVHDNYVYSLWTGSASRGGYDIFLRRSNDSGLHFDGIIDLSRNQTGTTCECVSPHIATAGNSVYVTWQGTIETNKPDGRKGINQEIFLQSSKDNGEFNTPVNLSNNPTASVKPQIAASQNNVYVTWNDFADGSKTGNLLMKKSTDEGANFSESKIVSNTTLPGHDSQLYAFNQTVYFAWTDISSQMPQVLYRESLDGGNSLTGPVSLAYGDGRSFALEMVVSPETNHVYMSWIGSINSTSNGYDLFIGSIPHGDQDYTTFSQYIRPFENVSFAHCLSN